jgi:hypothetical protein
MLNLEDSKALVAEVIPGIHFPELSLQNLYFGEDHVLHPTRKALVGTVGGKPYLYAEPSGRYQLVHHEQVIGNVIDFVQSPEIKDQYGNAVFEPRMWNNGGKMSFDISFPEKPMSVDTPRGKVEVIPRFAFLNSYDLTMKISLLFKALQLACLNGLIASRAIEHSKKRHMIGFDMPKMLSLVPQALENYPKQIGTWTKLAKISMNTQEFEGWANTLTMGKDGLLFGQKSFEKIIHLPIIGSLSHSGDTVYKQLVNGTVNMWEAHNAFTQFLTHEVDSEDVKLAKSSVLEDHFMKLIA